MDLIFLRLLNMNVTACYVILSVILVRLLLRKAPRIFSYLLWAAVLFRLVFPFSFESIFSLVRIRTKPVPEDIMFSASPQIQSGIAVVDQAVNSSLPAPTVVGASVNPIQIWIFLGEILWLAGVAALLGYSILTFIGLHRKLKYAARQEGNIYELPSGGTPFVFGVLNPRIYLPAGISETERSYILKHEQTHIKRLDHVIKPFAFLVLCIHWFNPLVWVAFFLMSADMELSCDESVLKQMGGEIKKEYSSSLLSLSAGKRIVGGCPLAFGEDNIRGRIKNILKYKKPAVWVVLTAVVVVAAVCIGLISDPKGGGFQDGGQQGGARQEEGLTVEDYAELYVRTEIAAYEHTDVIEFKIVDSEITRLERLDRFENLFEYPAEVWLLEYRLKPDDVRKVGQLGSGQKLVDGWITEDPEAGKTLLFFSYENAVPMFLDGVHFSAENSDEENWDTVAGWETLLRSRLEWHGLPHETYEGAHILVKFPFHTGETCQLFLSQPVRKGDGGIWCVERWMDGGGGLNYAIPETEGSALEYYGELQKQCDEGQDLYRLEPTQVALDYINNTLGQDVLSGQLGLQRDATIKDFEEMPESRYIGFISEFKDGKPYIFSFDLNSIELVGFPDAVSVQKQEPNRYLQFFQGTDSTRFLLLDPAGPVGTKDGIRFREATKEEFKAYLEKASDSKPPLFNVLAKGGFVQEIQEQLRPDA